MLKNILIGVLVAVVAVVAVAFAWLNPAIITLDLAFASFELPTAAAVIAGMVMGWLFGMACLAGFAVSLIRQRRRLRKSLALAESEVANLRSLPTQDAG